MGKPYDPSEMKAGAESILRRTDEVMTYYEQQAVERRAQLDSAKAELATLQAELAAAKADSARLDAIQSGSWTVHYRSMHSRWEVLTDHAHPAHRKTYTGKTARAAIDAARKGE